MATIKTCSSCKKAKPTFEFSASPAYKDGLRGQCKECRKQYSRNYIVKTGYKPRLTPKRVKSGRSFHLKKSYGMTLADYEAMVLAQDNKCAICKSPGTGSAAGKLAIDHCHTTGKVRGLLCHRCNRGLVFFGDNVAGLKRATSYLEHQLTS